MSEKITIRAKVYSSKPIYYNESNYYTIEEFQDTATKEIFTATGKGLPRIEDLSCILVGEWGTNKWGRQFNVSEYQEDESDTKNNCYAFLSSGLIKGIGPKTAERIVDTFGEDALKVLEESPERYLNITGITRKKLDTILESYKEQHNMKAITNLMFKYNLSLNKCMKIFARFHTNSEYIIKHDTYQLCEIDGFGFLTVDKIAMDQGPEVMESDNRYKAIVSYVLTENESTGSLYMKVSEFQNKVVSAFNHNLSTPRTTKEILDKTYSICSDMLINVTDNIIGLKRVYNREIATADAIVTLLNSQSFSNIKMDSTSMNEMLKDAEIEKFGLSDEQLLAVKRAMSNNVSIITGGAGTGKTTVLRAILEVYKDFSVALMAPTGRASKRMEETTGMHATTIHSKLKILTSDSTKSYSDDEAEMVYEDIVIVDETSMLDSIIAHKLFTNINAGSKVILIGDVNQLPSVSAGNVLLELINSNRIATTYLTFNFRQSAGSLIATNANRILESDTNLEYSKDEFCLSDTMEDTLASEKIAGAYERAINKYGVQNVALISPFRKNFKCGANSLNQIIQEHINPYVVGNLECKNNGETFRINDRVMQLKNRPYAMNGDIGTISNIEKVDIEGLETIQITVQFDGIPEPVKYDTKAIDELCLAYAYTIHKSQGSEYKVVILAYENNSPLMLNKNLIYTAVTRARDLLVIIGQKELINMSILKDYINNRISFLGDFVKQFVDGDNNTNYSILEE